MRSNLPFWKRKEVCHPFLAFLLFIVLLLRLPNFFEPYWYGDEGIYLTIGNGIRAGQHLYVDIVDHKTPLIYYFASVGGQLNFRILLVTWMLITTIAFYRFSERIFKNKYSTYIASLFFAVFTTLPLFEGNIPNGELFVMGFVCFGLWMLSYTKYFDGLLSEHHVPTTGKTSGLIMLSGALMSLGVLTKVPGVLDFAAALSVGWFALLHRFKTDSFKKVLRSFLPTTIWQMFLLGVGFLIPLIGSVVYFMLRGSGEAYLNFGLLYNFHYSGNWDLGLTNPLLAFLFTLPGKALILALGVALLSSFTKYIPAQLQFVATWALAALFASLLSNRPYPHYFLQLVPPLALLLGFASEYTKKIPQLFALSTITIVFCLVLGVFKVLNVGGYPTVSYYTRAYSLLTGTINYTQYRDSFNYIMPDNYKAAQIIARSKDPYMFIWGTNPMLYALSKKQPTGRFTVSFHITDLNVYDETFKSVTDKKPEYIVVMKGETAVLPGLNEYLKQNYIANPNFDNFVLWRKRSSVSL